MKCYIVCWKLDFFWFLRWITKQFTSHSNVSYYEKKKPSQIDENSLISNRCFVEISGFSQCAQSARKFISVDSSQWAKLNSTNNFVVACTAIKIFWSDTCELCLLRLRDTMRGRGFKNNFAKVFSACNYYAGIATTSNAVSFRTLWSKSVLQELVRSYLRQAQRYSRYTVQIFVISFLKLCASVRPVFLVYSPHKYCRGTDRNFFE